MSTSRERANGLGGGALCRRRGRAAERWADCMAIVVILAFAVFGIATIAHGAPAEASAKAEKVAAKVSPYHPSRATGRALEFYAAGGGVGEPRVQLTAAGNLVRFSYRVIDPAAAKALVDRNATPYLYALRSHVLLHVPEMEQIGQLRQTGEAQSGKTYWMVFSNKGNFVRPGDRVSVIVGTYHIDGLMVE